jgi:preprotein translocase subunit SecD
LVRADQTPSPDAGGRNGGGDGNAGQDEAPAPEVPTNKSTTAELLQWALNPDPQSQRRFAEFSCDQAGNIVDNPAKPLVACDEEGAKYLLSPALIEGTELADASYGIPQNDAQYVVTLDLEGGAPTDAFADVTTELNGTGRLFAIVLDGEVLTAPQVSSPITDGNAQITGDFTAEEAESLANSLKYGALPLRFDVPVISEEGPTLAGNQLEAGIIAGIVGLGIVLIYCMLYYRGLGIVVLASLGAAAAITYAAILFLSENAGFTLTLPGIAGLIVGVGVTADSFIVLFERIRDEMRDGKSVRVAVEAGWDRAKWTCVIADAVSLLAAIVLFIFAIGVVKGFAFALGISTVIDLLVFFLLTKPMVSWLARFRFFSSGHKWSGLSPEHAGIERIGVPRTAPRTAEGVAR